MLHELKGVIIIAELHVKNFDKAVLAKIDELAREKSMSRSDYVRMQLEQIAAFPQVKETENKYESLVRNIGNILNEQIVALKNLEKKINEKER